MKLKNAEKPKYLKEIEKYNNLFKNRNLKFVKDKWIFYWRFLSHLIDLGYRPKTVENYYYKLKLFLNRVQAKSLRKIKKEDVESFLLYLKNELHYKPYILRNPKGKIGMFFSFVMRYSRIKRNPVSRLNIRIHYKQQENMDLFSQDEIVMILNKPLECLKRLQRSDFNTHYAFQCKTYNLKRDYLIIKLMFTTGLRPCEIINMELEDIKSEELKLRIRSKGNQQYIMKDRNVYITEKTKEEITELIKLRKEIKTLESENKLFIHYNGWNLENHYPGILLKYWASLCGIKRRVYPYMARYTFCTRLVENGADLYSLKYLMGHKHLAVTLKHYLKLTSSEIRREWKKFNPLNQGGGI